MNTGLISTRYAKALLDHATALGEQEEVYAKVKMLASMFIEVPSLKRALLGTSNTKEKKISILRTACGGELPPSLERMFRLIMKNEREEFIHYIALRFNELYRVRYNIQYGKVITAIPMDKETEKRFTDRIREIVGAQLELHPIVDPSIIGGFVLYLDNYRWDASVTGKLSRIRNHFKMQDVSIGTR